MPQASSALASHLNDRLRSAPRDASLAVIFPGQGSHQVAAGRDLYDAYPLARELFRRAELSLVATRGRLMRDASQRRPGTMAALIGLSDAALDEVCRDSGVEPCNYNSPSQVVIGGPVAAVEKASRLAKERGARTLPLNASGAFHTPLMEA